MTRSEDAVAAPPMPRERGSRDDILRRERGPAVGREEPAHEGVQRVLNAGRVAIDERCEPAAPVAAAIASMRLRLPSPVDEQACFWIAVPCLRGGGAALLSPPLGSTAAHAGLALASPLASGARSSDARA